MNASLGRALVFFAGLSLGGCILSGSGGDGSPIVFSGATFADGADPAGDGPAPVAVHGTETLTVLASVDAPPFTGSFTAAAGAPSVLSIDSLLPPRVVVRGVAAGDTDLQIFPIGSSSVLAEATVPVASLSTVAFVPREFASGNFIVPPAQRQPWALLAGTPDVVMVVQLEDAGMHRLVDEATTVTGTSAAATQKAWDLYAVTTPASGQASFAIHAGGASFAATTPVVASIDDITFTALALWGEASASPAVPVVDASGSYFCLVARSGGTAVAGATWTFSISANLVFEEDLGLTALTPSCVLVKGTADGAGTLTATASGLTRTFPLTVATTG